MLDLNTQVELLKKDMDYIKDELAEIKALVKEISEKKADKWVERAIVGVVVFILAAVGTVAMTLVLK